jgi:uncharacterized coiled-coil protein SlyX
MAKKCGCDCECQYAWERAQLKDTVRGLEINLTNQDAKIAFMSGFIAGQASQIETLQSENKHLRDLFAGINVQEFLEKGENADG